MEKTADLRSSEVSSAILAVDCSNLAPSAAVASGAKLLGAAAGTADSGSIETIIPICRQALSCAGITPGSLAKLAAVVGPGSFTGVRIAISAAKGIGLGLLAPPAVIGLPTLCVTAAPWLAAAGAQTATIVCAAIQAGRGRYNWAAFAPEEPLFRPAVADHHAGSAAEFASWLERHDAAAIWLAGEIGDDLALAVQPLSRVIVLDPVYAMRRAGVLARLAAAHLAAGHVDSLDALQPLYLRQP